ncbi:hypothetical protein RVB2_01330 [Pseudomonas aeruginosa]|nr:hypothetical protein RVB2_01330 [Pseudomonas aeruginosa]GLE71729.1 hypothetical protein VNPA110517_55710 [Pseudomonas aeruginosa]
MLARGLSYTFVFTVNTVYNENEADQKMSTVVSFRADDALVAALDELARATHRDRPYHLRQALAQYLERQQWQVAAIDEGLADANAGRLLEHTEIEKRWGLQ